MVPRSWLINNTVGFFVAFTPKLRIADTHLRMPLLSSFAFTAIVGPLVVGFLISSWEVMWAIESTMIRPIPAPFS